MPSKAVDLVATNLRNPATWLVVGVASLAVAVNVTPANSESSANPPTAEQAVEAAVYREGQKFHEVVGDFRTAAGRIVFVPRGTDASRAASVSGGLVCLENLLLQRIATQMKQQGTLDEWVVSGELTEFQEAKYIYLRTARRSD